MARLTQEMKDMVASQQVFHATVSKDGMPNIAPKRSTRVLDDETLIFTEGTGGATYRNVLENPTVSSGVVNRETVEGYRFISTAEMQTEGPLYEQAAEESAKMGKPAPKGVVLLHIKEIHSLTPGPGAGKPVTGE